MRRMIETAPQDGKFVILEEDARGNYDVARWSSEVGGWVGEDGEPINITPTHWHPTQGENHLQQGLDFSFFLRRAAEQRATAGDVLAACSVAADPVTRAEVGAQTTLVEAKRVSQARWRFAATVLAASLVAAAFTGMYFRAQVTYEVAQLRKVADAKAAELQQERDHSAALASELATVRRDFETTAALSSKAADEGAQLRKVADANAAELQQERDHSAALASELATVRRDFETMAALSSKAADEGAQLRKVADAKATELQQERDHSAALASELATVRRDFETTAAPSSKAADEGAQLRKVADAKAAELQQERDHSAALASELATVRRDFETTAALSSKAADEGAQLRKVADARAAELQQERDHSAALASELATVRRDFETTAALSSTAGRKVAEAKAELKQEPDRTASLQGRAPAAGAPVAAPPARKFDPDELATLMNRAKILVAAGDISPARLLLERAAEAQEPTAALMLARTYDPDVLRTENVRNIIPDPALARIWYQRAAQLGSADAQRRLSQWEN